MKANVFKDNKGKGQIVLSAKDNSRFPPFIEKAFYEYFDKRLHQTWHGQHILKGKKQSLKTINFTSNDYLQISRHPELIEAQIETMRKFGNGQMLSPVFLNDDNLLLDCEQKFADFMNYPAALITQSGWCANIGLIQALASKNLPIYLDFYSHMSLWEGAKAACAKPIPFSHNSIASLRTRLERFGSGIIAIDSIYSGTGTVSPLKEYVQLANEFDCLLIVDESHSLGTHGPQGSGLVAALGLSQHVPLVTASLAKAISGRGGMIAGEKTIIELIRYTAFPAIFSSALLPHDLAGFIAALTILKREGWRRQRLHQNANFLREQLLERNFNLASSNSQIIPLVTGSEANTIWLRDELEKSGVHGAVFCAPATPKNKALIRLSVNTNHKTEELKKVIACLEQLDKSKLNLPFFGK